MYSSFRNLSSFCLVLFVGSILVLSSCENPGSVGSGITKPKAEISNDTLYIQNMSAEQTPSYSGQLQYLSAGQFDDPLFGSLKATGFVKPALPSSGDTLTNDLKMLMRVRLDKSQEYGDTLASQSFSIYEISEIWRDKAIKVNDQLSYDENAKVGSFTVEQEDSIDVEISSDWVQKYTQYADTTSSDSLYQLDLHGLAIVPDNSGKIIPIDRNNTDFIIQNAEADTFAVNMLQGAYTLQRGSSSSIPANSTPLHSTYESILTFSELGLDGLNLQASGISKAELILYENTAALGQGLAANVSRANESRTYLQLADPKKIPDNIDPGIPLNTPGAGVNPLLKNPGIYSAVDGTYRIDITTLVTSIVRSNPPQGIEYFITLPNDGVIKSSLIYTDSEQAPASMRPKIIITSLKDTGN